MYESIYIYIYMCQLVYYFIITLKCCHYVCYYVQRIVVVNVAFVIITAFIAVMFVLFIFFSRHLFMLCVLFSYVHIYQKCVYMNDIHLICMCCCTHLCGIIAKLLLIL